MGGRGRSGRGISGRRPGASGRASAGKPGKAPGRSSLKSKTPRSQGLFGTREQKATGEAAAGGGGENVDEAPMMGAPQLDEAAAAAGVSTPEAIADLTTTRLRVLTIGFAYEWKKGALEWQ